MKQQVFAYFHTRQRQGRRSPRIIVLSWPTRKISQHIPCRAAITDQGRSQVGHSSWPGEATNSLMPAGGHRQRSVGGDMVCVNLPVVGTENKRTNLSMSGQYIDTHIGSQNGNTIIPLIYSHINAPERLGLGASRYD